MDVFTIKQDDTSPSLVATLRADGVAVDLSGASAVHFVLRKLDRDCNGRSKLKTGPAKVDAAGVVEDAAAGKVRYDWAAGDTDAAGVYALEVKVTSGGRVKTYPSRGYAYVHVGADLR